MTNIQLMKWIMAKMETAAGAAAKVIGMDSSGKVEVYLRNNASTIDGGYHKLLAGSKLQLTKLGEWTYPEAV